MKTNIKNRFLLPALIAALGLMLVGRATAQTFTTLHSFTALSGITNRDGAFPYAGLILSGNTLYGTAYIGGSANNGTVFRVNTDGSSFTNLHSFSALVAIALLGIAQRQIHVKFSQKARKENHAKPLPTSIKLVGDWIQTKRREKNLTPGHLATKMGIAAALIRSWEDGTGQPDSVQMKVLASLFGYDADFDPTKEDLFS